MIRAELLRCHVLGADGSFGCPGMFAITQSSIIHTHHLRSVVQHYSFGIFGFMQSSNLWKTL